MHGRSCSFSLSQHSSDGGVEVVKAFAHGTSSITLQHSDAAAGPGAGAGAGAPTATTASTTKPPTIIMHNNIRQGNGIFIFKQHTRVKLLKFRVGETSTPSLFIMPNMMGI